jgi:hypothetical protein
MTGQDGDARRPQHARPPYDPQQFEPERVEPQHVDPQQAGPQHVEPGPYDPGQYGAQPYEPQAYDAQPYGRQHQDPQHYGQTGGYDAEPPYPQAPYPPQPSYEAGRPYDPQQPYGAGPAHESVQPFDPQHAHPAAEPQHGGGHPQDWTYVPEPLGGQLPPQAESGAAFGVPSSGDAWDPAAGPAAGGQGWQGDPQAHGGQGEAHGAWSGHEQGVPAAHGGGQPWPGGHDAAPAQPSYGSPHGYADAPSHPYGQQAGGVEHTAVLPVFDASYGQAPAGRAEELPRQPQTPQQPDPQAAPVRTGSPIIPPGIQPAAITVALALLTAGGAALGKPVLGVVLLALEGLTAAGWFRLNGMWPARQGIALAFLGGVTADIGLLAADGGHATEVLLGTLGVWLLLVLVLQLRHHGSPGERLSSLTATSVSALLTVAAASYLATAVSGSGSDPVVVGACAVAAATLVRAVRLPGGEPVSLVLSLLGVAATAAATAPMTGYSTGHSLLVALACGAAALIGLRVASYDFPSRFVHFTAGVALPLTAAAPVVYALGAALN